jgi:hypothetical protein
MSAYLSVVVPSPKCCTLQFSLPQQKPIAVILFNFIHLSRLSSSYSEPESCPQTFSQVNKCRKKVGPGDFESEEKALISSDTASSGKSYISLKHNCK